MFACTTAGTLLALLADPYSSWSESPPGHVSNFERGRRDLPKIALTFDGGGDSGESATILDVLEQRGVTATFFLTGRYITRHPEIVRRIAAAGHEVGNHTWSHPHLTDWDRTGRHEALPGRDRAFLREQLQRTAEAYLAATGQTMSPLWRAPYGEVNRALLRWAAEAGWNHVGWTRDDGGGRHTLDSLDWVNEPASPNYLTSAQIALRILSFGQGGAGLNGGVVLMHLSTRRDDPWAARLGDLVDELRRGGHHLVVVSELRHDAATPALSPLLAVTAPAARDPATDFVVASRGGQPAPLR